MKGGCGRCRARAGGVKNLISWAGKSGQRCRFNIVVIGSEEHKGGCEHAGMRAGEEGRVQGFAPPMEALPNHSRDWRPRCRETGAWFLLKTRLSEQLCTKQEDTSLLATAP